LSVVNLKETLDTLITKPDIELLITDEKLEQNFEKGKSQLLINQISKLNGNIGCLIISHSFLKQNEIGFSEELKNEEMAFLIKVLKAASNIEFSQKKLHHNYSVFIDLPESEYIPLLNEMLLKEQLVKSLLNEHELIDYTNVIFINNLAVKYIDIFKKIEKDKLQGLEIIKEIYQTYETYYNGQNEDLNNFVKVLF